MSKLKSFAHMLGLRARAEEETENDTPVDDREEEVEGERLEGESDEDFEKRTGKKAKKAEEDECDEGDCPEMSEEEDDDKEKAAALKERARCAAIIAHGIKLGCVEQAGVFAFDTDMTAAAARSALDAGALARNTKPAGLGQRMRNEPIPRVTTDGGAAGPDLSSPKGAADAIIAAGKKARGEA